MTAGAVVRYREPQGPIEAAMRFRVMEAHLDADPPRVRIRLLDPGRWGFAEALAPVEVIAPGWIVEVAPGEGQANVLSS